MLSSPDPESKPCYDYQEMFFSEEEEQIKAAKNMCAVCPFKFACLMECLETETLLGHRMVGTFGGTTRIERTKYEITAVQTA